MKTSKDIIKQAERDLREQFEKIDDIRDYNQEKVLNALGYSSHMGIGIRHGIQKIELN